MTVWCIFTKLWRCSTVGWHLHGEQTVVCRLLLITMAVGNFSNTEATLITKASLRPKWGRKARRCCSSWHHRSSYEACIYVEIVHIYISLQLLVLGGSNNNQGGFMFLHTAVLLLQSSANSVSSLTHMIFLAVVQSCRWENTWKVVFWWEKWEPKNSMTSAVMKRRGWSRKTHQYGHFLFARFLYYPCNTRKRSCKNHKRSSFESWPGGSA